MDVYLHQRRFSKTSAAAGVLLLGLAACDKPATVFPDGTALILVMDGVRLEESLGDEPSSATGEQPSEFLPSVWDERLGTGVRSTQAWSLAATTTAPAHAAIVTGRRVPLANYAVGDDPGVYRVPLPTLAETLRRADTTISGGDAVIMGNTKLPFAVDHSLWPGMGQPHGATYQFISQGEDSEKASQDDSEVLAALQDQLEGHPVRVALANLHQVDRSGHYGDNEEHLTKVRGLDRPLANFWDWLDDHDGYAGDTWVLLTADHGRHSNATSDPPWRHHGCACNGCRRVPFLLTGPGVAAGSDADGPVLLVDYAPTLAALQGLAMPWADGLVRDDLLDDPTGIPSRSGLADLAAAGELQSEIRYLDDPAHRSELWVEGQRLSDPDAIAVEGAAMATDGALHWLCFREVVLSPDADETGWLPRCMASDDVGETWSDIGFPVDRVGPYWRPAMSASLEGVLMVAWAHDPNGLATESWATEESDMSVDLARWDGHDWQRASAAGIHSFPQDAALLPVMGGAWVAISASGTTVDARHERDVHMGFALLGEDIDWQAITAAELSDLAGDAEHWRLEYPALADGPEGRVMLAASGFVDDGSVAVVAVTRDGQSWEDYGAVELPYRLMPHIGPVWLGQTPVWATVDPETQDAWICGGLPDAEPTCTDANTTRILRMVAHQGELHVIVDLSKGEWELRTYSAETLGFPSEAPE